VGVKRLYVRGEGGEFVRASGECMVAAAREYLNRRVRRGVALKSPQAVRDFLALKLGNRDCEFFCVLCVDSQHRLLRFVELFRGTIDRASVHPREIVRLVLEARAAAVLLAHNHPSQVETPSAADEQITKRIKDALALIDVKLVDHFVVAGGNVISFSERGLI